jgi:transcriptional regulator with XRE-family HTH domain
VENELLRIGQELKKCREAKGLTIEKLAGKTKIAVKFIKNFEEGQFDFLPDVYIQAFLKSLALEVGLDKNVILRQFKAARAGSAEEKVEPRKKPITQDVVIGKAFIQKMIAKFKTLIPLSDRFVKKKVIDLPIFISKLKNITFDSKTTGALTVGGLGLVLLVIIFFSLSKRDNLNTTRPGNDERAKSSLNAQPSDSTVQSQSRSSVSTLTVKANENTWLRIVFDDSLADEATFSPGDVRSWESHGTFYLRIGNVGGVELILNGKNLGPPGQGPQIANLKVDEEGIKSIAASEFPSVMLSNKTP